MTSTNDCRHRPAQILDSEGAPSRTFCELCGQDLALCGCVNEGEGRYDPACPRCFEGWVLEKGEGL